MGPIRCHVRSNVIRNAEGYLLGQVGVCVCGCGCLPHYEPVDGTRRDDTMSVVFSFFPVNLFYIQRSLRLWLSCPGAQLISGD